MIERAIRATVADWRPWAIGAALSIGCAALLVWRRRRADSRVCEEWWRRRDELRANGSHPHHPELFV